MQSHLKTSGVPRDGAKPQLHDVNAESGLRRISSSALVRLARALGRLAARYRFGSANTASNTDSPQ